MSFSDCLSILEIAAYRSGNEGPEADEHLATCARCRALLASIPELRPPDHSEPGSEPPRIEARVIHLRPTDLKTGQLWTAKFEGRPEWREVVVVLASQPAVTDKEAALVAPVNTALDDATATDLIVRESPLGYPHVVSIGMQGILLCEQLDRYLGRLEMPEREALVDIYRALLHGSERTTSARTGLPLGGPEDPRASARAARIDELRPLFAPADRLLGEEAEHADPEMITLGGILADVITSDEWSRQSLLTAAGVDGAVFDRMLADQLELTDQTDVPDVQRVLNVIQLDDWRNPVRATLRLSRGGEREATGAEPAIAARSFAGVSDAERERDLMRDQTAVDESARARERAIDSYLHALEKEIDDAS